MRTRRKTIALYVRKDGSVEVRAPLKASKSDIDRFVEEKSGWIQKTKARLTAMQSAKRIIRLTEDEQRECRRQFAEYLQLRCTKWARDMGFQYGKLRVNQAKTILGSCNSKGDLSFTFRLFFVPKELVDYVIVHELAHTREMNHSERFWKIVEQAMPDYKERRKKLKEFQRAVDIITDGET